MRNYVVELHFMLCLIKNSQIDTKTMQHLINVV